MYGIFFFLKSSLLKQCFLCCDYCEIWTLKSDHSILLVVSGRINENIDLVQQANKSIKSDSLISYLLSWSMYTFCVVKRFICIQELKIKRATLITRNGSYNILSTKMDFNVKLQPLLYTIGKNVWFLNNLTNANIVVTSKFKVKQLIPINPIPANDQWRIRLLQVLLDARKEKNSAKLNLTKDQLNDMLQSLCIS